MFPRRADDPFAIGQDEHMVKVIEAAPGDDVPIWIQDRGGSETRLRGHIVIEDLRPVLKTIAAKQGANGPQNPVTQYMLAEASNYLADRLLDDARPLSSNAPSVPRLLSSALGHQPFVESVLGMSQHQMLRRWPLASDWYTDVVHYIMRPARFIDPSAPIEPQLVEAARGDLGGLIRRFIDAAYQQSMSSRAVRVAEALQTLWPDYPPVRDAMGAYREMLLAQYVPLFHTLLDVYDLKLHPHTDITAISWAFNGLHARNVVERLAGQHPHHVDRSGQEWSLAAYNCLLLVAGACTDLGGSSLSPEAMAARPAVRPMLLG